MNEDIYYNEPAYYTAKSTEQGKQANEAYSNIVKFGTVNFAIKDIILEPPSEFEYVIKVHYYLKKDKIL